MIRRDRLMITVLMISFFAILPSEMQALESVVVTRESKAKV